MNGDKRNWSQSTIDSYVRNNCDLTPFYIAPFYLFIASCSMQQVSYQMDIKPILNDKCIVCHSSPDGIGYKATGLRFASYESLMTGTFYGPVVLAGDSQRSIINKLVEGRAGKFQQVMHDKSNVLSHDEIMLLKLWVDQGALHN